MSAVGFLTIAFLSIYNADLGGKFEFPFYFPLNKPKKLIIVDFTMTDFVLFVTVSQFFDPVPFPPTPPSNYNIQAICDFGNSRPRYPPNSIPSSWSSHFRRRATAINLLESWYQLCCDLQRPQHEMVHCAQNAVSFYVNKCMFFFFLTK